ncbi:histidinol phosphate phosphatase domain-containing protein [Dissulfurirhabdus thermomarina]|uniref:Histidinol phosphate phosphatase domain-containing protein n=1 Tax=Dissulfurirhabdus thermomarina TaxID=1765737 RepID=A0A6N9TLY5_DISTH|nr:histidinol phosphate phosphatase domain-containing protein [Dissulfurirhabdus thermomarina]NDY42129.1 histidinol phosphate phosphatase domain-containing protein [Dissulfurirhabdus thermomarina]NMX23140.1 histidinol phosphate phosphatase domain-containing protein [Dissulfurirhabdus thermomarina]
MIDLHCHCLFSDGELLPSELVRRVAVMGYEAVAITDHADASNMDHILPRLVRLAEELNPLSETRLLPGIELTHVPPERIAPLAARARELGALVVVCHGETPVEPVRPGTNRAALEAGVDILSHPGLIAEDDVRLAAERGIFLELSGRKGHCLANGHVAALARRHGAPLVVNSDGHAPGDFLTAEMARRVALGAGVPEPEVAPLFARVREWAAARR